MKAEHQLCDHVDNHTISEIQILIFKMLDLYFGFDFYFISNVYDRHQVESQNINTIWFHQKLNIPHKNIVYSKPKIAIISGLKDKTGIIIDSLKSFKTVNILDISAMPSIINYINPVFPIWGIVKENDHYIFLVDPIRLVLAESN